MRWGSLKRTTRVGFHAVHNEVVKVVAVHAECEHSKEQDKSTGKRVTESYEVQAYHD